MRSASVEAWASDLERLRSLLARETELRVVRREVLVLLDGLHRRGCPWTEIASSVAPAMGFKHATISRVRALAVLLRKRVERNGTLRPIEPWKGSLSNPAKEREKERTMGRVIKRQVETTWEEVDKDELGEAEEAEDGDDEDDEDDEEESGTSSSRRRRR